VRTIIPIVLCALALASCNKPAATGVRVDPALATLVPAGTALLVGAKLDKLRETPVYQKHLSRIPLPRLDEFSSETGLDPRRDIWEVLFASNGSQSGVLMVRGKFATGELEPKLQKEGATHTTYKGYGLFGDDRNALFFMNSSTALTGTTSVLKTIIDNRDRSGSGIPATLQPLVSSVPAGAQLWAVFNGSAIQLPFPDDSNIGNLNQFIRSIQSGRFSADLRAGFDLQATGTCATDRDAKRIHDAFRGLIGLGRLNTPDNQPDMLRVYDSIDVKQDGRTVNVAASVPEELVDKFLNAFVDGKKHL
jgi:hypothetical protein